MSTNMKFEKRYYQKITLFIVVLSAVLYGGHAFTLNYLYDTDDMLYFGQTTMNWLEIGRQGAVFTQKLFDLSLYNPYLTGVAGITLFIILQYLMVRLLCYVGVNVSVQSLFAFVAVFATSPIWVYQFYFSLQWIEVVWAMLLLVAVESLSYLMFHQDGWYKQKPIQKLFIFITQTLCLIWSFSTYQAMVGVFITLCASLYLLSLTKHSIQKEEMADYLLRGVWQVAIFGVAYLINQMITNRFFSTSDYLVSQRVWGIWDKTRILEGFKTYFKYAYWGLDIPYSWLMGLTTIGVLIALVIVLCKRKYLVFHKCLYGIAMAVTIVSAHLMNLYCGTVTAVRSQIAYPFELAFLCFYIMILLPDKKVSKSKYIIALKCMIMFVIFVGSVRQMSTTFRLWYTDDVKCKIDMEIMDDVIDDIQKLNLGYSPSNQVVFVGNLHPKLNASCYDIRPSEYGVFDCSIGVSCWRRVDEQPNRLVRMIQSHLGVEYVRADWGLIDHAKELAVDMPCYPDEGYVQLRDDLIIVKMGNY